MVSQAALAAIINIINKTHSSGVWETKISVPEWSGSWSGLTSWLVGGLLVMS